MNKKIVLLFTDILSFVQEEKIGFEAKEEQRRNQK
jgi:hypothetical protein